MTFNPDLIQKARKGEIAIFNDGSADELQSLLKEVWPRDEVIPEGIQKYYVRLTDEKWDGRSYTDLPRHSVKDFFLPSPLTGKEAEVLNKTMSRLRSETPTTMDQPRTYKVTRGQMKEIRDMIPEKHTAHVREFTKEYFDPFETEAQLSEKVLVDIIKLFEGADQSILKKHFPEYFFIPEGEAVLCRDNLGSWVIGVSDGKGKAYVTFNYNHAQSYGQIIPFTKNPPK